MHVLSLSSQSPLLSPSKVPPRQTSRIWGTRLMLPGPSKVLMMSVWILSGLCSVFQPKGMAHQRIKFLICLDFRKVVCCLQRRQKYLDEDLIEGGQTPRHKKRRLK